MLRLALALVLFLAWPPASSGAAAPYDWLQFDGNAQHSGDNTQETVLTPRTVGRLQRLFRVAIPSFVDGAQVYLHAVTTSAGVADLLIITTFAGHVLALNAQTGATVWRHDTTTTQQCPAPFWTHVQTQEPCYTSASPAIDPNRRFVYSYGLDGYAHKYAVGMGAEITNGGWPALVTRKPALEKVSAALSVATPHSGIAYLYVTTSSFGDTGDYQGHLTAINLVSGAQHVFNALCSERIDVHLGTRPNGPACTQTGAGIWSRPAAVYDGDTDRIYVATGNGAFAPAAHDWGETVLALHPDGSGTMGAPLDSYTPANSQALTAKDADLGSAAPVILPPMAGSDVRQLAVQGSKDGTLRLLNLDNLSSRGGPGHVGVEIGVVMHVPQGEGVLPQPAVWVNPRDGSPWVFVATRHGLAGIRATIRPDGVPTLVPMWTVHAPPITSPLIAGRVLYCAGSGHIQARDPLTGAILWQDDSIGAVHWASPVVANGILYIADERPQITAYALPR